jgi:hypothetical protein
LLVWTDRRRVAHWKRKEDHWRLHDLIGDSVLELGLVEARIPLASIYQDSGV